MNLSEKNVIRKCNSCGKEKPLDDFATSFEGKLGKTSTCKKCISIREKKRKSKGIDYSSFYMPI